MLKQIGTLWVLAAAAAHAQNDDAAGREAIERGDAKLRAIVNDAPT